MLEQVYFLVLDFAKNQFSFETMNITDLQSDSSHYAKPGAFLTGIPIEILQ
jgi:hypothetical protein